MKKKEQHYIDHANEAHNQRQAEAEADAKKVKQEKIDKETKELEHKLKV